jgi:hypothetical protein
MTGSFAVIAAKNHLGVRENARLHKPIGNRDRRAGANLCHTNVKAESR